MQIFALYVTPAALAGALLLAGEAGAVNDWDLYSMRLVNRARSNPSGESAIIGSPVVENAPPVPPLAYHLLVGDAASNHNDWMHDNLGNIDGPCVPASFTHRETLDCTETGPPAVGTPSFTGVTAGDRITFAGFAWNTWAENIITSWSTSTIPVNQARIDANHLSWWNSAGHRANILSSSKAVYGHRIESRTFTPPLGGLNPPFDNLHFATQNFSRPQPQPRTYLLGLLFDDLDASGEWTPRNDADPLHEGLASILVEVLESDTSDVVATTTTMTTGAFTVNVANGAYDVVVHFPGMPGSDLTIAGVTVAGANVDLGDFTPDDASCDADFDETGDVGFGDMTELLIRWGPCPPGPCPWDLDGNGNVGFGDLTTVLIAWGPC
jgi:hypothetical protein